MHVIGTAGHVDHGKSSLIAALTGTNPDRLLEERVRGMTLDLGFAHLRFDDGIEGGIVDVPGHERFLHNMLAGAAGMEILLLVIDAAEGVMPQTVEHLQILQFLNVRRVLVVASKIDLVEPQQREAAFRRIGEQLQGTIAAAAPLFGISSATGEGIDALKAALHEELATMPPRNVNAPVYLPIDRVFTLPGRGTIVTGTLMQGAIESGERLRLEPGGATAHVRSIGVFESRRDRVEAGSRTALSLSGIGRSAISRGQALVGPEFSAGSDFAVRFVPLQNALGLLRRRTPVRAYVGSAEILGTLVCNEPVRGQEIRAELHLREPVVAFPGVRFVLRRPSPMMLLGGGHVEGVALDAAASATSDDDAVRAVLRAAGIEAAESSAVAVAANLREDLAREALERLADRGEAIRVTRPAAYADAAASEALLARVLAQLGEAHRHEPWAMGMTSLALARAIGLSEPLLVRILEPFVVQERLVNRDGYYARAGHRPAFSAEQLEFFERLIPADAQRPFLPISFGDAGAAVKGAKVAGIARAFDTMLAGGELVKVGDDLYRGSQIARIRKRVEEHLRAHRRMTAAEFRDLLGTSRKYAVPLLEWLDAHAVTIRSGDYRTLRGE